MKLGGGHTSSASKTSAKASAGSEDKSVAYLIKVSRRFGDGLIAYNEAEKIRIQSFLHTIDAIESGSYAPQRGGGRKGAGRRKNPTHKEAIQAGDIKDNK